MATLKICVQKNTVTAASESEGNTYAYFYHFSCFRICVRSN